MENDDHGYGYKTLEIYHLKLKDANLASANFNKAIELDTSIDIDDYAEELKQLSRNEVTT